MGSVHNDLHTWACKARRQGLDTIEIDLETADRAAQQIVDLSNRVMDLEHEKRTALTPPAEPVSRPAEEGEREAVARLEHDLNTRNLYREDDGHFVLKVREDDLRLILSLLRPAAPSDSEMRDAISLILPLAKGYAAAHPVGSNQAYVDYVESLVSNEGDDVIRPVEPEEIKAAYQRGWNDREADIIERTERIAPQPDALAVLDRLLAHSGARGTFDAMKHGDAVKEAEALLQARRDEPGASSWPEVTDAWAETYCALTGKDPDGQQVTFVDGATVTTFRDMARREIEAMLCAAPKSAVRTIATAEPAEARIRELEARVAELLRESASIAEGRRFQRDRATAAEAKLARAVEACMAEPKPEQLEPFARKWCEANGIDPDAPKAPHGEWPEWYDACGPFAAMWRDISRQTLAALQQEEN